MFLNRNQSKKLIFNHFYMYNELLYLYAPFRIIKFMSVCHVYECILKITHLNAIETVYNL